MTVSCCLMTDKGTYMLNTKFWMELALPKGTLSMLLCMPVASICLHTCT